ncbi:hypothetical protein Chor_001666 [Crotalus horridus]
MCAISHLSLSVSLSLRKPADLQNLAPGTHPPFITYNNEVKTDVNKIEEFLEEVLCPPKSRKVMNYFLFQSAASQGLPDTSLQQYKKNLPEIGCIH